MNDTSSVTWIISVALVLATPACGGGDSDDRTVYAVAGAMNGVGGGGPDGTVGGAGGDGSGHLGDAADCEPPDPELADADADQLFDYPHVPTFHFYMPPEQWEDLKANALDEEYVPAQACFEGRQLGEIAVRFKGNYGSLIECFEDGELVCPRLSMKAKFSEYDKDKRFYGLKRLNFHAYRHDDSRMKEKVSYDLFRGMGIVTPRASWAVLHVNGESQGLYGMVEQVDGRFTADRWPENPDGNLYKEVWPSVASHDAILAGLKTNEEEANVDAFVTFAEAVQTASEQELRDVLSQYLDLDYLARFLAVEDAVAAYDGITYFWTDGVVANNHNFYLYEEGPESFSLIPWDLESSFWINPDHAASHWTELQEDCTETYAYWGGLARAPACDPVLRVLANDPTAWRAAAQELLDGPFGVAAMQAKIDAHKAFIQEAAHADPTPDMYSTFDDAVEWMRLGIPAMRARLEALMEATE